LTLTDRPKEGWLHEDSFGEKRTVLLSGDTVIAARLHWFSKICAGTIARAKVVKRPKASKRALCVTIAPEAGHEVDVPDLPRDVSEGSEARIMIHREPMAERGRLKRAKGRYWGDKPAADAIPSEDVLGQGEAVRRLPKGIWEEVWSLAAAGELAFDGGGIVITPTPAMTLIDIDGAGSPRELSLAAVPAIARAIRWLDLGGNIGIDFPSIAAKAERREVDEALAKALSDWPHERTAMNGFGFVQLVGRLEIPSLLHRLTFSRAVACARYALRQAERLEGAGTLLIKCHPAVKAAIAEAWIIELQELSGKQVRIESDPSLALEAPQAQIISA
jgi:hypothetical protein